ncbi:MAG: MBL fold metallo-hydrolase [Polyangiales bacterium]
MLRPRAILPGVELFPVRTPTLPPATHTNSYARGQRALLLVEPSTPYDDERRAWLEWARGLAGESRAILGVLLTHHHVDHGSSAGFFTRALGVPLLAHEATLARTADLEGVTARPLRDGETLTIDDTRWTALHTPGHAPGHVCLWEPGSRVLVAGDMVANGSTILVPPDDDGDMGDYLAQLVRLQSLGASTMLPAHGEPIDDPATLLAYYVAHRLERERKVLAAWRSLRTSLAREPEPAELVPVAYADTPTQLWPLARASLIAHLVKLRREGRLVVDA